MILLLKHLLLIYCVQAVTNINTLLDKADRVYHQLMGHRPQLESLLSKVNEAAPEKPQVSLSALFQTDQLLFSFELPKRVLGVSIMFS